MATVFISYKRNHEPSEQVARTLEEALRADCDVLRDTAIAPGAPWSKELYTWLLECDAAVAIVSQEANAADWCRREWSVLAARQRVTDLLVLAVHVDSAIIATGILDDGQALKWSSEALPRIRAQLAGLRSRSPSAQDFLAAHQAWLRWQYRNEQVLGQEPFALSDVYIDTECGELPWSEINAGALKAKLDPFEEINGGRHELIETVLARIVERRFRDLIVVQAGPGSGKSAFTLRLANELIDRGLTPILVRFRDLRLATFQSVDELIDDAIRIGHADEDSPAAQVPIVSDLLRVGHTLNGTTICRSVFILDGWDEVSLSASTDYRSQLRTWLPRLREYFIQSRAQHPVRLILTGRPSSEVGDSGVLASATPVFTIRPIRPDQLRGYAMKVRDMLANAPAPAWSIDLGKLTPVFAAYDAWFASFVGGDARESSSSGDILGNPLLAYLGLRVMAEAELEPQALVSNPTALYHELIEATVKHAGKGRDEKIEGALHRGGLDLRHLLQEVASTITMMRSETVSYSELQARFEDPGLPIDRARLHEWAKTSDTRNALRELVVNFYFKGGHTALGCEFLHKSFREYLFAEAIVAALSEYAAPEQHPRYDALEFWQDFDESSLAYGLSRRLAYLLGRVWLTKEVELHLTSLMLAAAKVDPESWQRIRNLVVEVFAWWAFSVHLRHQPGRSRAIGPRWTPPFVDTLFCWVMPLEPGSAVPPLRTIGLDAHLGHALARIACVLHEALPVGKPAERGRRREYQSLRDGRLRFKPGGDGYLARHLARIDSSNGRLGRSLEGTVSGPVDLSGEQLPWVVAESVRLTGASLTAGQYFRGGFYRADLTEADLSRSDLRYAVFRYATLSRARLVSSDLLGADMLNANLSQADLHNSNLTNAQLRGSNLCEANLSGANLTAADLSGANLVGANLSGANLSGAKLTGTKLQAVDA